MLYLIIFLWKKTLYSLSSSFLFIYLIHNYELEAFNESCHSRAASCWVLSTLVFTYTAFEQPVSTSSFKVQAVFEKILCSHGYLYLRVFDLRHLAGSYRLLHLSSILSPSPDWKNHRNLWDLAVVTKTTARVTLARLHLELCATRPTSYGIVYFWGKEGKMGLGFLSLAGSSIVDVVICIDVEL